MGTKEQPGKFDCYHAAEPDEPLFVLLARDKFAPDLVREWARMRENMIDSGEKPESDRAMIAEAFACADAMADWRKTNRK